MIPMDVRNHSETINFNVALLGGHNMVLDYLGSNNLTLVGEQLEPAPAGEVISDGEAIDGPPVLGTRAGPLRYVCTSSGGREARVEDAGRVTVVFTRCTGCTGRVLESRVRPITCRTAHSTASIALWLRRSRQAGE